jgi:undecaprenyl-phosphate galactose phosphotransferase
MLLTKYQTVEDLSHPAFSPPNRPPIRPWGFICALALIAADCIAMLLAAQIAIFLVRIIAGSAGSLVGDSVWDGLLYVMIGLYFTLKGRYTERIPFWYEARIVAYASASAFAYEVGLGVVNEDLVQRDPTLIALILFPIFSVCANRLAKHLLARAEIWTIRVVVVGSRAIIAEAEDALRSDPSLGYLVVGRLDSTSLTSAAATSPLKTVLERYEAKCLFIATEGPDEHRRLIERALQERVRFATIVRPFSDPGLASMATSFFSHDLMLLWFQDNLSQPLPRIAKSALDILVALVLLVLTSPVLLAISAINFLDGGPILFRQQRIGAAGRPFYCLKFRTMTVDADQALESALAKDPALAAEWEASRKLVNDPRITPIGRFLRRSSLDELPQLINVLRREMSLVGPRPIVEREVHLYGDNIAQYYATRPGLTGLWQVSGRSNTTYARRVQLDVWYVNNWTFWSDIIVLLKTIPAVVSKEGAV